MRALDGARKYEPFDCKHLDVWMGRVGGFLAAVPLRMKVRLFTLASFARLEDSSSPSLVEVVALSFKMNGYEIKVDAFRLGGLTANYWNSNSTVASGSTAWMMPP